MVDYFLVDTDDVLTLVVVDQVESSEGRDDVVLFDTSYFANFTKMESKINKKSGEGCCELT